MIRRLKRSKQVWTSFLFRTKCDKIFVTLRAELQLGSSGEPESFAGANWFGDFSPSERRVGALRLQNGFHFIVFGYEFFIISFRGQIVRLRPNTKPPPDYLELRARKQVAQMAGHVLIKTNCRTRLRPHRLPPGDLNFSVFLAPQSTMLSQRAASLKMCKNITQRTNQISQNQHFGAFTDPCSSQLELKVFMGNRWAEASQVQMPQHSSLQSNGQTCFRHWNEEIHLISVPVFRGFWFRLIVCFEHFSFSRLLFSTKNLLFYIKIPLRSFFCAKLQSRLSVLG